MRLTRHTAADVDRDAYLDGLNCCFPGWGGIDRFDWCFSRPLAGRAPDLLLLSDGSTPVAGSAITYRMLELPDGTQVRAGIMTGSWTLPAARGCGAFSRFIEESRAISPVLLAFVTQDNPSRRRLEAAGAAAIPTFYCRRATSLPPARENAVRFVYSDEEWQSQFVARPAPAERLNGAGWSAVIEQAADTDRILHVAGDREAAFRELVKRDRDLFWFTTGAPASLDATPGYLMVFGCSEDVWEIQNGDRM